MSAEDVVAGIGPGDGRYTDLECVSAEDLARLLGKSESWLYTLVRQGKFPHVKAGGSVLFPRRLVARWLEGEFDASADLASGAVRGRVDRLAPGRPARRGQRSRGEAERTRGGAQW